MRPLVLRGARRSDGATGPVAFVGDRLVGDPGDGVDVDATGLTVAPGLVDLQVNGAAGHDLSSDPAAVWEVARAVAGRGVTAFLPTLVSGPLERVEQLREVLAAGPPPGSTGAVPLGIHVEGPFLAPTRRGTHDAAALRPPDVAAVSGWRVDRGVRLVTLAPELPGALEVIDALVAAGVVVSLGHTDATAAEARAAVDRGARAVTHLWNGMRPVHHRSPGPAAVALVDPRLTVGLIADGVHVADDALRLAWHAAGGRIALVSDAMAAAGMPDGTHRIGAVTVTVAGGVVRSGDGTLAGSAATLEVGVRRLVGLGVPVPDAFAAAATVPAGLLGDRDRGRLAPGARADLVLVDDALDVRAVVVGGQVVVDRDGVFTVEVTR